MAAWRQTGTRADHDGHGEAERRGLGLLIEGIAVNQQQYDPAAYRRFRSAILRDSIRLTQPQSEADILQSVGLIIHEFEAFRVESEATVEARQKEWRQTTGMLMNLLAAHSKIDHESAMWMKVATHLASASTSEEISALRSQLHQIFDAGNEGALLVHGEEDEEQDRSVANDNAAGLRGGGAAIEHVSRMINQRRPGFIGLFRLSCLDVVGERFGPEGMQDCLMTVSAFLAQNLRTDDTLYHWSESALLAVCDRKVRGDIVAAELNRILARNREFTISIGGRNIMLRIPIDLQLFPVEQLKSSDDLEAISAGKLRGDYSISDRVLAR